MAEASIVYKKELFYGEVLRVSVAITDLQKVSFDVVYKLEKETEGRMVDVAHGKTGMVCFDFSTRKVVSIPEEVKIRWK